MTVIALREQLNSFPDDAVIHFWDGDQRGRIHSMELDYCKFTGETDNSGVPLIDSCEEKEKDLDVLMIEMYFTDHDE